MPKTIGALIVTLVIAVFAPVASAAEPRTGPLAEPEPYLILDLFAPATDSFENAGTWEEWVPPEGLDFVVIELFGGVNDSTEAHGHVAAGLDLAPGEIYQVRVGGPGEDTVAYSTNCLIPEWWECEGTLIAAGGDAAKSMNQTNLVPPGTPGSKYLEIEEWEGGGPDEAASSGRATFHYWVDEDEEQETEKEPAGNTPPTDDSPPTWSGPGPAGPPPAKAYGYYCRGKSKKHVKGEKGTEFSRCVKAMAKGAKNPDLTPRQACRGLSKKHVKGEKGTEFSRCVKAVARLRKDQP